MNNVPVTDKGQSSVTQFLRYAFIGMVSNLAGYVVYLLVTYLGGEPKTTMTLLYPVGATIGFLGNRTLTFAHKGSLLGSGARYVIAHGFGYCINLTILIVLADSLGYAHQLAQAIAVVFVGAFLFMACKFYVFKDPNVLQTGEQ